MAKSTSARVGQSITLVGGGLVAGIGYEWAARPFDNARRIVHENRTILASQNTTCPKPLSSSKDIARLLYTHIRDHGVASVFRLPVDATLKHDESSTGHKRLKVAGRALARLGPWSIAFLMWEGMGSDLVTQYK